MRRRADLTTAAVALLAWSLPRARAFAPPSRRAPAARPPRIPPLRAAAAMEGDDAEGDDAGMLRDEVAAVLGGNWMTRSASVDFMPAEMSGGGNGAEADESVYLDVGINGAVFGTGDLSRRMHEALMRVAAGRFPDGVPPALAGDYLLYAMDASAKEAVKAALDGNGHALNLASDDDRQDEGAWGRIDGVALAGPGAGDPVPGTDGRGAYPSFREAIEEGGWAPGDGFSFVVREVPARKKAMDLDALLRALDPDGTLRAEAEEQGIVLPGDDEVASLPELEADCAQRVRTAPSRATDEAAAFRGDGGKGYNVIARDALRRENREDDGTERQKTLLHVMDSLANHGCLIVDLSNGDTSNADANKMSKMWDTATSFFDKVLNDESAANSIPPMQQAEGVGSSHAVVGFASFKDGDNQFLETRLRRADGALLPEETAGVVGDEGAQSLADAFEVMADVGKDVVRIATAAASVVEAAFVPAAMAAAPSSVVVSPPEEGGASIAGLSFEDATVSGLVEEDDEEGGDSDDPSEEDARRADAMASAAAARLADEIMDDGRPLRGDDIPHNEGPVSMSPHRLCRYSSKGKRSAETFGAHTDTSFVTIVPAAPVSGLEVFDEDALQWYRPELNARKHAKRMEEWCPWHCRYLVVVPGELLQLTSRNNIPAAVHRVVTTGETPRLSAPVLLRARPGTKMDVERYMGSLEKADRLLLESHEMRMEDIHDALQPSPKQ